MGLISSIMGEIVGDDVDLGNLYQNIGATGQKAQQFASQLASELPGMTAFKPFTVTSGTSQVQATPEGGFNIGLSPQALANQQALQAQANYYMTQPVQGVNQLGLASQQAFDLANDPNRVALTGPNAYQGYTGLQNQAGGLASQFLGSPAVGSNVSQLGGLQSLYQGMQGLGQTPAGTYATRGAAQQAYGLGGQFMGMAGQDPMQRERDIYGNIRAMQTPEEQRQRMALEERLFNQGRGGVSTNLYGGTPEQLAMAKAQAEAQNQASLVAMQQAQAEQAQQAGLGAQFLGLGAGLSQQEQQLQNAQQQRALQAMGAGQSLLSGGLGLQQAQFGLGAGAANLMGQLGAQRQSLMSQNLQDLLAAQQMGAGLAGSSMGLQQAQQQLGLGALGASYLPEQQALGMLSAAAPYASIADIARRQGAGLYGETAMSGMDALMAGQMGQANLVGGIVPGVVQGLGNVAVAGVEGLFNKIF
jgi:hypothetical protein